MGRIGGRASEARFSRAIIVGVVAEDSAVACGAKKKSGGTCGLPPGYGTNHLGIGKCKFHGGSTPSHVNAAKRKQDELRKAQAEDAVEVYGLPRDIEPHDALIEELGRTAGHVAWLHLKVSELDEEGMYGPVGGGKDSYPKVERHIWLALYQEERDRMVRVAKTCIEVGIEERRVKIAEEQGQLFATALDAILQDLGVADKPETPKIVRKHLTGLDGGKAAA